MKISKNYPLIGSLMMVTNLAWAMGVDSGGLPNNGEGYPNEEVENVHCSASFHGMPDTLTQVDIERRGSKLIGEARNFGLAISVTEEVKARREGMTLIYVDVETGGKKFKLEIPTQNPDVSELIVPNKPQITVACTLSDLGD